MTFRASGGWSDPVSLFTRTERDAAMYFFFILWNDIPLWCVLFLFPIDTRDRRRRVRPAKCETFAFSLDYRELRANPFSRCLPTHKRPIILQIITSGHRPAISCHATCSTSADIERFRAMRTVKNRRAAEMNGPPARCECVFRLRFDHRV